MSIASRIATAQGKTTSSNNIPAMPAVMYSPDGAAFQEWALQYVTQANKSVLSPEIGRLVTAINNGQMSRANAEARFTDQVWACGR